MSHETVISAETPEARLNEVRKKYLDKYQDLYGLIAKMSALGSSVPSGTRGEEEILTEFLVDLGLKQELGDIHQAMREKYPDWDGSVRSLPNVSYQVGGSWT